VRLQGPSTPSHVEQARQALLRRYSRDDDGQGAPGRGSDDGGRRGLRYGELLFSYLEYTGEDLDADNAAIAADAATRDWWAVCEPLQRPLPDRSPGEWWKPIPEVFHLD
jgi:hypothetical protein